MRISGTGSPTIQPSRSRGRRPHRSEIPPAKKLTSAFVTPKVAMKEIAAALEVIPKSASPMSGRTVRSIPTMPPTKAFVTTSSRILGRLSPSPNEVTLVPGPLLCVTGSTEDAAYETQRFDQAIDVVRRVV